MAFHQRVVMQMQKTIQERGLEVMTLKADAERLKKRVNYLEIQMSRSGYEQSLKDAERFQKLERNKLTISYHKKGIGVHRPLTNYPYELHKTLRDAIDAARGDGDE